MRAALLLLARQLRKASACWRLTAATWEWASAAMAGAQGCQQHPALQPIADQRPGQATLAHGSYHRSQSAPLCCRMPRLVGARDRMVHWTALPTACALAAALRWRHRAAA